MASLKHSLFVVLSFSLCANIDGGHSIECNRTSPTAAYASAQLAEKWHDDTARTAAYYVATKDERALFVAKRELALAYWSLEEALDARFGAIPRVPIVPGDDAKVELRDNMAIVFPKGQVGVGTRFIHIDGHWKLPMDDILRFELMRYGSLDKATKIKHEDAQLLRQVLGDLKQERYSTRDEVMTVLAPIMFRC